MAGEVRGGDGDAGVTELRKEAAEALAEARRLLDVRGGWAPADAFGPVIDRLAGVETALAREGAGFSVVFVHLGILRGARCMSRGDGGSSDPEERDEALRRLRWADGTGPLTDPLAVQARMMLVFLLAPWALPRADGTRTALLDALLSAADGQVLTASLRRDLTEALEVVGRIAAAPLDPHLQQVTAGNRRDIEQMLAVRSGSSAGTAGAAAAETTTAPAAETTTTAAAETTRAPTAEASAAVTGPGRARGAVTAGGQDADAPDGARDPVAALLDAVRGLVGLA
ncbi:hypothetical protein GTW67_08735, partial [Streptomyces sp. SID5910]|nr:hypothetical protein [Streptomyces sp. SID5910]